MSARDELAQLLGDTFADMNAGWFSREFFPDVGMDGEWAFDVVADAIIAAGWQPPSAEKTDAVPLGAQREIAALREALAHIEKITAPNSHEEYIARRALLLY